MNQVNGREECQFPAIAVLEKVDPLKSPICFHWVYPVAGLIFFKISIKL